MRLTEKFPDRWLSLKREKRERGDASEVEDEMDVMPDLGMLWAQAGRRGGATAGLEDEAGGSWSERSSWTWQKWCLLASVFTVRVY